MGLRNLVHSLVISGVLTVSPTGERNPADRKSVAGFSMLWLASESDGQAIAL
jgi:hypothetical protein